ncbi:MAG TPA: BtrH N-terminal domain-containing protein [Planctomycetota bacterium]|nr:BtrH N-terminal domain-containing protein [Planctomycetota bacterium]
MEVGVPFEHRQSAHCESGVISALLRHAGLPMSEPMAFGISGGLTFAYVPLIKFGGMPLIAYRMPPKGVIRGLTRRLGIKMSFETFRDPDAGMATLDRHLAAGRPVGAQTSVFWLDYFPPDMRFHFNAHNMVVHGKRGDHYLISDPVMDTPVECDSAALKKSRFTRGALAPKGLLYYPLSIPRDIDLAPAIKSSIRANTGMMLHTPVPFIGIRGVRYVANKLRKLPGASEKDRKYARLFIGHMVRMQEEIGTGGAGFRFLHASFLQEAAPIVGKPELLATADRLTKAGDEWRQFALLAAKMCKGRVPMDQNVLADELLKCADMEAAVHRELRAVMA